MHPDFRQFVENLAPKVEALLEMTPVRYGGLPRDMPKRGIYLFSDGASHLYVGRTNRMRQRLAGHCLPSSTHFSATFAFRLARQETGMLKASYAVAGSRADLVKEPVFAASFARAKARLAQLDLRFVEETEPVRQALLEIYAAVLLKTPYNDFDNH
jgi:predicted GIY-YIG superfamily endonuclease